VVTRGDDSERESVGSYQDTCAQFLADMTEDYKAWVERYELRKDESNTRKQAIDNVARISQEWIYNYGDTIKKIDLIMNDGINKMAESTAGYPFFFEVTINGKRRYTVHEGGLVRARVKATPREGRLVRISNYQKNDLLLLNSTSIVSYQFSEASRNAADVLDDYIVIDASRCQKNDLISVTITVEEVFNNYANEKRGYSTLILINK
jgi:hypothetical protein